MASSGKEFFNFNGGVLFGVIYLQLGNMGRSGVWKLNPLKACPNFISWNNPLNIRP